jgi:hypothetical protein
MNATRSSKKARPSFDVARAELGEHADAWVYRSDAPPSPAARAEPRDEPSATPRAGSAARPPSEPARSGPGWIETGIGVMVMPLTLTMLAMIAPLLWIGGSRPRR